MLQSEVKRRNTVFQNLRDIISTNLNHCEKNNVLPNKTLVGTCFHASRCLSNILPDADKEEVIYLYDNFVKVSKLIEWQNSFKDIRNILVNYCSTADYDIDWLDKEDLKPITNILIGLEHDKIKSFSNTLIEYIVNGMFNLYQCCYNKYKEDFENFEIAYRNKHGNWPSNLFMDYLIPEEYFMLDLFTILRIIGTYSQCCFHYRDNIIGHGAIIRNIVEIVVHMYYFHNKTVCEIFSTLEADHIGSTDGETSSKETKETTFVNPEPKPADFTQFQPPLVPPMFIPPYYPYSSQGVVYPNPKIDLETLEKYLKAQKGAMQHGQKESTTNNSTRRV